jgi:hypothetical protein
MTKSRGLRKWKACHSGHCTALFTHGRREQMLCCAGLGKYLEESEEGFIGFEWDVHLVHKFATTRTSTNIDVLNIFFGVSMLPQTCFDQEPAIMRKASKAPVSKICFV